MKGEKKLTFVEPQRTLLPRVQDHHEIFLVILKVRTKRELCASVIWCGRSFEGESFSFLEHKDRSKFREQREHIDTTLNLLNISTIKRDEGSYQITSSICARKITP